MQVLNVTSDIIQMGDINVSENKKFKRRQGFDSGRDGSYFALFTAGV